ncbi:MAG: Gfo/Idh/MocA family oxidoreductase [Oscillospiraceae bacterium]|nr:Gfo/Idh/MocA family oxidoreductase [Oscillospiraceae bacterium]
MLRWGILSTGMIAKKFAATLGSMGGEAALAGVASRSLDKAKAFAEEYGAKAYFGSHEELANAGGIDAVYIATPNRYHFESAMLCLNAGKHVLCEKPFTTNAQDARKLFEAARGKGLFLMDGIWTMHLPMYHKIRQLIAEGEIGEVRHVRAEYGFAPAGARKEMKLDSSLGGGALLDVGIYNIAFAALALGLNPNGIKAHLNICDAGTDDLGTVILTYGGGKSAALSASIGVAMPIEGVIFGTKGRIALPNYQHAQQMVLHKDGEEPLTFEMPFEVNGFEYQIREAARCIRGGLLESERLDQTFSVGVIKLLDDIRKAAGLRFSFE